MNTFLGGKNKLAGTTFIRSNNTLAISRASTPTIAPIVASAVFLATALSLMAQYLEDDLHQILKTILDFRPSVLPLPFIQAPQHKNLYEKLLKTRFPDVYLGKIYMECYSFF